MTRAEAWLVHLATLAVGGTGVVYGWMRYVSEPADEFSVVNHPLQPALHDWHILLAPLLVFACALVWRDHVWPRVRGGFRARRRTGLVLFAVFVPMIVSGYALQVSVSEAWRTTWIVVHVATSVAWCVGYAIHQLSPRRRRVLYTSAPAPRAEGPVEASAGASPSSAGVRG